VVVTRWTGTAGGRASVNSKSVRKWARTECTPVEMKPQAEQRIRDYHKRTDVRCEQRIREQGMQVQYRRENAHDNGLHQRVAVEL
jgi:hypothetical protein